MAQGLCWSCKSADVEISYTDDDLRQYCQKCFDSRPSIPPEWLGRLYLLATIPFKVGDRVECRTAGKFYDGIGTVVKVSMDIEDGGTPVYPAFLVRLETKEYDDLPDEQLYLENCLKLVEEDENA